MEHPEDYLRRVGHEGFEIIEAFYGPSRNPPPPEYHPQHCKYVYNGPRTQTVLQEPFSNSTTYVYQVQTQFAAGKQACQAPVAASKEVVSIAMADQMDIRYPKLPSQKSLSLGTSVRYPKLMQEMRMLYITSDQAAKNYGGSISKEYYW